MGGLFWVFSATYPTLRPFSFALRFSLLVGLQMPADRGLNRQEKKGLDTSDLSCHKGAATVAAALSDHISS